MSYDEDYKYALELQKRLNAGFDDDINGSGSDELIDFKKPRIPAKRSNPRSNLDEDYLNRTQNLVHPQWETLDPTPDVNALFEQFDTKFFQSRLKCVTLEWSKRMYSCAGICYSRKNRYGMDVTIRLSEPLLKLRSRKDLVETMLHEMIHAYCFVLNIREGNGGHGPQFKKIMNAINKVAGTNITVYHTFHDEVNVYKQHWWRCNGVCQDRSPFFGYVKRTSNRAPGPNDIWWAKHQYECGGTFMKIKEPEKTKKNQKGKDKENSGNKDSSQKCVDLRNFFVPKAKLINKNGTNHTNSIRNIDSESVGTKANGGSTLLLNPRGKTLSNSSVSSTTSSISKAFPPSSYPGLSTNTGKDSFNIMSFTDLSEGRITKAPQSYKNGTDWGIGNTLNNGKSPTIIEATNDEALQVDRQHLREIWSKRFDNNKNQDAACGNKHQNTTKQKMFIKDDLSGDDKAKRPRLSSSLSTPQMTFIQEKKSTEGTNAVTTSIKDQQDKWFIVDDDVMVQDPIKDVIAISSDDSDDSDFDLLVNNGSTKSTIRKDMTIHERQNAIKKEILDETLDLCENDIELIDDEYDDEFDLNKNNDNIDLSITAAIELADTSIIDEFFGEDTLLKEFREENDLIASGSRYQSNPDNDIITCPICQSKMARSVFSEHLNGCTGITVKIEAPKHALQKFTSLQESRRSKKSSSPAKRISLQEAKDILKNSGYADRCLDHIVTLDTSDETVTDDDIQDIDDDHNEINFASRESDSSCNSIEIVDDAANTNSRHYRQRSLYKTTRQCPICAAEMEEEDLAYHIKECRKKSKKRNKTEEIEN